MTLTYQSKSRNGGAQNESLDPILDQIAKTNTFDSDWLTLRDHLRLALTASLQPFLTRGPPRSTARAASPSVPGPSASISSSNNDDKPPPESLLLSPGNPTVPLDSTPNNSTNHIEPSSTEAESSLSPRTGQSYNIPSNDDSEIPSTPGGLVIPPFPPLDRNKKRRESQSAGAKINGHARVSGIPDDDWDENVIIGGKKLAGWLEESEAKKEISRVDKIIEEMEYAPFTIQRIAELLNDPTKMHSTIGKFLRALEKALLVNTPWEAPSYVYVPPTETTGGGLYGASTSTASSSSSGAGSDEDSLLPPGASTPMFSPIPFLRRPDADESMGMDLDAPGTSGVNVEEGLMSPLVLSEGGSNNNIRFADAPTDRSPTPEPDESSPTEATSPASPVSTITSQVHIGPKDPGHQSYLGRVDELDTGPLAQSAVKNGGNGEEREDEIMTPGAGEGGNMTPHGMSDKPVPISSTTVLGEEERKIAGIPKASLNDRFVKAETEGGEGKED